MPHPVNEINLDRKCKIFDQPHLRVRKLTTENGAVKNEEVGKFNGMTIQAIFIIQSDQLVMRLTLVLKI